MKRRTKRLLATVVLVVIIAASTLNILAYNHAHAMLHFTETGTRTAKPEELSGWRKLGVLLKGVNIPRPERRAIPSEFVGKWKTLSIPSTDDITIEAWYGNYGASTPLVMLFHGYSAEKSSLLEEAKAFMDLGCSVLLVDFRGCGGSSGNYTTIGAHEARDVSSVFEYSQQNLSHSATILYGQSMGAVAITKAIHDNGVTPDAVILAAIYDDMLNTIRNRFRAMAIPSFPSAELLVFWGGVQCGFNGFRHNPVDYVESLSSPALFMHGENDSRAKIEDGRRVFDAATCDKEFILFTETGHESYLLRHPDRWRAAVSNFLSRI